MASVSATSCGRLAAMCAGCGGDVMWRAMAAGMDYGCVAAFGECAWLTAALRVLSEIGGDVATARVGMGAARRHWNDAMSETVGEGVSGYAAVTMLQHRRAVRRSFGEWCRHRGYEPALHHRLIISAVEEFLSGDDGVLLIFAPPGQPSRRYVSVLLPPWYLANHPKDGILFATHSVEFAERWGRRVRNDIAAEYKTLGIALSR